MRGGLGGHVFVGGRSHVPSTRPRPSRPLARVLLAALAAGCLGASAACQANPEPEPLVNAAASPSASVSAPATPAPSSSASPSKPAAPTLPAAAKGASKKSAKAFARYYFATLNYAGATGDVSELRKLGSRQCKSCKAIVRNIDKIYSAGGYVQSRGWLLRTIHAVQLQPKRRPILDLGVYFSPQTFRRESGGKVEHVKGRKQPMTMYLARRSGNWTVVRLGKVA